ncbi:hypothetical protein LNAOJCKE_1045 [Methylorubrum aminovorans]|uniref:GmrSD restriction endonucleases N-terminal domain-containing protein n=1 Tax=Methylorubrum aminovorans TaxID=269069 RepID=A0ABQ4UBN7_9HYPH|nr:DUF262 domain-containing protein [Methylorubrum aminovorans]GJE63847.1 hypothetical protein LNAOJCKE_1045 [Methylorubrum aminovorans]GMA78429.1 hypothetical protein GCM10025880_48460 [Methylorubrum aminovorans]
MARQPAGSMEPTATLDTQIDTERNNIRTDKIDLSYGELASLYENKELIISPEYQRLFRWTADQKASFIESLLLGFPVPAIFVAERDDGVWELVDGLQRLSTVFEFMGSLRDIQDRQLPPLTVSFSAVEDHKLPALHGTQFDTMSLRSRLALKRTYCRVEVIKVGSAPAMKYDVFERLNTGGARLEPQEVRNAIFRSTDPEFMEFIDELARFPPFADSLQISPYQKNSMYDKGLVLRFFTLKNNFEAFSHDVDPFITNYIRKIVSGKIEFDRFAERFVFEKTFALIYAAQGADAWKHLRDDKPQGAFSVYLFDSISIGVSRSLDIMADISPDDLAARCLDLKRDAEFRDNTGPGGNTGARMRARLSIAGRFLGARP